MERKFLVDSKILFLVIVACFFWGCEKKTERMPDKYFNVNANLKDFNGAVFQEYYELDVNILHINYYLLYKYDKPSDCWSIQFYNKKDGYNYLFKIRRYSAWKGFKAFYIKWPNIPYYYKSFINSPYIYTSLDSNSIHELYPDYKGKINTQKVSNIEVQPGLFYDFYGIIHDSLGFTIK